MNLGLAAVAILYRHITYEEAIGLGFALILTYAGLYARNPERKEHFDSMVSLSTSIILIILAAKGYLPEHAVIPSILIASFRTKVPYYFSIPIYFILGFLFLQSFPNPWSADFLALISLTTALGSSLVVYAMRNDLVSTSLVLANTSILITFDIYKIAISKEELFLGFVMAFLLSLIAYRTGVADETGLMAATIVGMLIIVSTDIRYFIALILFYAIGSAATKYRYRDKEMLGVGEPAGGARGCSNVFANSLPALFFALNYGYFSNAVFSAAFIASLSTALGDTLASEFGKMSEKVYLITSFERVKPGESGGVSAIGEVLALAGSGVISLYAILSGILGPHEAAIAMIAGFIGVHIDSILGATAEKRELIGNSGVNFLSTLLSGLLVLLIML